jgi:signal transduction histidine kinase|tara:strand:- start:349 stop:864 length:516 start_codon:yes stop_codon:yes gene_type:complete
MTSIEYAGMKFTGGKVFAILTLLSALGGAAWTGFTFYQDYLNMKEKILTYTEPDLSGFDKKISLLESETKAQMEIVIQKVEGLKSELDIVLEEVNLIASTARELKDDLKTDLRQMEGDVRHITEIVNDVEDRQKEDNRELLEEMKLLEDNLDLKINKALNNPLTGMSAKTK